VKKRIPPSSPQDLQIPEVVFQPRSGRGFQAGINQIVDAIRPSLGPHPRTVAIQREIGSDRSPEMLDSGGIIARRILELPDSDENAGAMFIRGALWNLHKRVGDGVATAAILFQSIYNQGLQYLAAGGNAMILGKHLEVGMEAILAAIEKMTIPITGQEALAGVARTVCHDDGMADALGEVFSVIGEYGLLEVRAGRGRQLEREFIQGSYWPGGLVSNTLISDIHRQRTQFEDAAILITDLEIEESDDMAPILQAAVEAEVRSLVILARKVSDKLLGLMFQHLKSKKLRIMAVKTPGSRSDEEMTNMEDLAVLTGGIPLIRAAGDSCGLVTPEHFGYARRIWANMEFVGVVNGQGNVRDLRTHVANLRTAFERAKKAEDRERFQDRLGRLYGGAAGIDVGGITETEMETRKELAKRTVEALRGAIREGITPGGGVTLLACRTALDETFGERDDIEARATHRILKLALEAPFRAILANSGYESGAILDQVERAGPGFGFDVISGQMCELIPTGIMDVAAVQRQAVISAIRGAAMALTIDVLVHRKKRPLVTEPDAPGL
jgi:chaperonin GroEL